MWQTLKKELTRVFLGDLVHDFGTVYRKTGKREETLDLALYRRGGCHVVYLVWRRKGRIATGSVSFGLAVRDLKRFVTAVEERYDALAAACSSGHDSTATDRDRLPLLHRALVGVWHGVGASKRLVDREDLVSQGSDLQIYGYIAGDGEIRVLVLTTSTESVREGEVFSGAGLKAALKELARFADRGR